MAAVRSMSSFKPSDKAGDIEARCAATGMRMTEQRRVIARVLADSSDHPDVEELYRRCVAIDDKISISTVYRTVKLFEDAAIIERHDFREGRARYEQMRETHHDHLINLRDGTVIEFTSDEIEQLQAEIARKLGYKLVDHRLELYCVPLDPTDLDLWALCLYLSGQRSRQHRLPSPARHPRYERVA
jgi:Fur family ferric uptake transcriptional regulator